jgi:putative membrane protein
MPPPHSRGQDTKISSTTEGGEWRGHLAGTHGPGWLRLYTCGMPKSPPSTPAPPWPWLGLVLAVLVWSGIGPRDGFTWFLEVAPVLIALPLLALTYHRFPFTPLAYGLMAIHAAILMVGGHYTYAEMPLFNWLRDALDLARNHYDRVGHVAQGFIPAIVARELLLRRSPLEPGKWLFFLVTCACLAISAFYEMIEWWVAIASGDEAVAFLATQGDVWDTQWDMFLALLGALSSQLLLGRWHDRQLARLPESSP